MFFRCLFTFLLACCCLNPGVAQETETEPISPLYEAVVFPDRSLSRRLEQAARLFETGRSNEAAQLLGGILENADAVFLMPGEAADDQPLRTLRLTVNDYIINRIRNLPREARESYAFQFEPTARRLLDNAVRAGSLDDVQQVVRKYFPTASGANAAFLVACTQCERGDYAAAFLTVDRLKRLHSSIPETLQPVLEQMHAELQNRLQPIAPVQKISEPAWLEQVGWRLPVGSPSQNTSTMATAPLLEPNWTVPVFNRVSHERETESIARMLESSDDVYLPASQPLLVGDLLITRTFGETIAVDTNTGKRLWAVSEPEYRFPEKANIPPLHLSYNLPTELRLFFWHNRPAQQLSSDGERLFGIDGHGFQVDPRQTARMPNVARRGDDLRFDPGNTLTARDLQTGRILWQVGKFPYVQKQIDTVPSVTRRESVVERPADADETLFTEEEKLFKETWFLGAPLPLHGRLYVIGETDGILQLFMLESHTGRLIARQAFSHVQSSLSANMVRRTYPLFPSASEGIVICPTGNGLIAALDAVTLLPIWCFSYAPAQTSTLANRRMLNQQRMLPTMNVSEYNFRMLFAESGWQVPRMIIDGQRVLVAPPDRGVLYCLDLLSGKLLWEQTVSRPNALYVACVQNDKAFVVTPINLMVFDMNTGKETMARKARFPSALKPAGVGVLSGNQYFIPFTDGQLAVADLDKGTLTWLDASGLAIMPSATERMSASDASTEKAALDGGSGQREAEWDFFSPDLVADNMFQRPIRFGNLVGIKGRFFSQSPTQIASFDQKEPMRQRAETLLSANPNDPEGLLKQGRVLRAEGRLAEAIASFRASMKSNPTPEAADALRRNLLEAMRNDYAAWGSIGQELESLAEFSDEWGMILYAQFEGILQSGTADDLAPVLENVFALGHDPTMLIPVSSNYSVQLHRALGGLIDQHIIKGNRPALRAAWEELAETFYLRLQENPAGFTKPPHISALPTQWLRSTVPLPYDIQRWSMFAHLFRNTRAAEKAKPILWAAYEQYRLPIALDLQEKLPTMPEWSELSVPFVWKPGPVNVRRIPTEDRTVQAAPGSADRGEVDRNLNRLLNIANNPDASRFASNQLNMPFLGALDSEHVALNYVIAPWTGGATELFLCCNDSSGQEQWRIALPGAKYKEARTPNINTESGEHAFYVKGNRNLLLLVVGNFMAAIDVSPQSEAKILWSKTLSSTPVSKENSRNRSADQRLTTSTTFPKNSLFVSPHVIAVCDANYVYGLDPKTGQTLWVRKVPQESCSVLGDDNNLFLVFSDVRQIIAVDPASGKELADAPLPIGSAYYTSGTNIIFAKKQEGTEDYVLHLCDLRDIYAFRRRAVLIPNPMEGQLSSPIPSTVLYNGLNRDATLIQMLHGDRFLSVANWGTKSLQVHDLLTKKNLLPEGNHILQFVSEGNMGTTKRCDIEFVEDRILVLFTKDFHIRQMDPNHLPGTPFQRVTYNKVTNVPGISIAVGEMMLFDAAGNPCWSEPTNIKTIYRLWDIPDRLPVMVFAVSMTTRITLNSVSRSSFTTRIVAVDKRSGKFRFQEEFGGNDSPFLQTFRITADPASQEITFTTAQPPETVKATFTDE